MVTRILSGKSIRGLLNYNENKVAAGQAELILASKFGAEIEDLRLRDKLSRFQQLTILNDRAKTNAIHIMLNFDRQDKLPLEKLQVIAVDYMARIGFGDQPFLVYQHRDANHPHIHIVTTNIQSNGERIAIHNIGKDKDEKIRLAMQQEYGLVRAEGRIKDPLIRGAVVGPAAYGSNATRQSIYNVVTAVMREYKFTSLAEYNAVLGEFNIVADRGQADSRMYERRGLVYAILDQKGKRIGMPIKASALAGKPVLDRVEGKFLSGDVKRKAHAAALKDSIGKTFGDYQTLTRKTFMGKLRRNNIGVVFRQNETGQIYGVTYVDHNTRCVFNGSDLGKAYSAKALLERFDILDRPVQKKSEQVTGRAEKYRPDDISFNHDRGEPANDKSFLETLLMQPDFDPINPKLSGRQKKKKKKGPSIQQDPGNQIR